MARTMAKGTTGHESLGLVSNAMPPTSSASAMAAKTMEAVEERALVGWQIPPFCKLLATGWHWMPVGCCKVGGV